MNNWHFVKKQKIACAYPNNLNEVKLCTATFRCIVFIWNKCSALCIFTHQCYLYIVTHQCEKLQWKNLWFNLQKNEPLLFMIPTPLSIPLPSPLHELTMRKLEYTLVPLRMKYTSMLLWYKIHINFYNIYNMCQCL